MPRGQTIQKGRRPFGEVTIQATCRATLTRNGRLGQITKVLDYDFVSSGDVAPFNPKRIDWKGRVFWLNRRLSCRVLIEDGLWVIEHEPLGIRSYAKSRDEAVADFCEEFAMLWDEYRNEDDRNLTKDAQAVKKHLIALVCEIAENETKTDA